MINIDIFHVVYLYVSYMISFVIALVESNDGYEHVVAEQICPAELFVRAGRFSKKQMALFSKSGDV